MQRVTGPGTARLPVARVQERRETFLRQTAVRVERNYLR
ncbi:MAG: hypothetical protein AVDCRST_MAG03-1816 [uncultured Rubrobacteraceae bacterium]|uniref:Uncharacterized protein n=1 Tax=uncultured Rubrobacteraceae bacterium TaxID=349277 RepID=A0A6J4P9W1_9ACTN|nr:MAG: hypothetical protein AVDCRST_MAG03-1816 [uncultured Rubrobacteraceae bacterium]